MAIRSRSDRCELKSVDRALLASFTSDHCSLSTPKILGENSFLEPGLLHSRVFYLDAGQRFFSTEKAH